jgi:hypothetical protein
MRGTPRSKPTQDFRVRPMTSGDMDACAKLCAAVHGTDRTSELRNALRLFTPFVVERQGRMTGYLSAATFWLMNHGVAETEQDMEALILGASSMSSEPVSFLLPSRQASLFRWCLSEGMKVVKPMTLMTLGKYQEPRDAISRRPNTNRYSVPARLQDADGQRVRHFAQNAMDVMNAIEGSW